MLVKFLLHVLSAFFITISITTSSQATTVDWSTVSLSGTFPDYSFTDATLGLVDINYSNDTEFSGIRGIFGSSDGSDSLVLGDTGGESLTISWFNTVFNLEIPIWDVDAIVGTTGESITFVAAANVSPVSLHTSDVWDASTRTLSSDGTENPNQIPSFTVMRFLNPAGFNSITFNMDVAVGTTGGLGIGDLTIKPVPVPAAIWLFGSGVIGLTGLARRKKS